MYPVDFSAWLYTEVPYMYNAHLSTGVIEEVYLVLAIRDIESATHLSDNHIGRH